MTTPEKSRKFLLFLVLTVALGLRLTFVLLQPSTLAYPDETSYNSVTLNFLDGKGFILSERLRIHRTPGYPVFLAIIYTITGKNNFLAVGLIQAFAGAATVLLIGMTAGKLYGRSTGLWAAAIATVYPFHIYFTPLILTETLFTLLLAAIVASLVTIVAGTKDTRAPLFFAGLCAGLAVIVKPSLLPFIFLLMVLMPLLLKPTGRSIAVSLALFIGLTVFLTPWVVRNYKITNEFVPTTLWTGKSLYEAVGPQADGGPAMDKIRLDEPPNAGEYEFNRYYIEQSKAEIRKNPARFARLALIKFTRFWNIFPNSPDHRSLRYKLISAIFVIPLVIGAIMGMIRHVSDWKRLWPLIALPVFYTLIHMVFVSSIRYRAPIMGCIIVLAVGAFRPSGENGAHVEEEK